MLHYTCARTRIVLLNYITVLSYYVISYEVLYYRTMFSPTILSYYFLSLYTRTFNDAIIRKKKQPGRANLLLRAHVLEGEASALGARALEMVEVSLKAMAKGGIYDHLFDGFARFLIFFYFLFSLRCRIVSHCFVFCIVLFCVVLCYIVLFCMVFIVLFCIVLIFCCVISLFGYVLCVFSRHPLYIHPIV